MAHGSVIVDMAAEQGGNCALTERDKVVEKFGVTIIGLTDLPSRMARQSSELYATTVFNLLKELSRPRRGSRINLEDEIHRGVLVLKDGELMWPPPKPPPPRAGGPTGAPRPRRQATPHADAGARSSGGARQACSARWRRSRCGAAAIFGPPDVPPAPDGVPARLRRRLARRLERDARRCTRRS